MRTSSGIFILLIALGTWQCGKPKEQNRDAFAEEDFVTENFLAYQDSLMHAWNMMMSDDNEKLEALHDLLAQLRTVDHAINQYTLARLEDRLTQLHRIRYTQKSMANPDVIEEYDFASAALIREILSAAEMSTSYAQDLRLQQLVDQVRLAEERVANYRADYDDLVGHYNVFLDANKANLVQQMSKDSLRKKTRFELVSLD